MTFNSVILIHPRDIANSVRFRHVTDVEKLIAAVFIVTRMVVYNNDIYCS